MAQTDASRTFLNSFTGSELGAPGASNGFVRPPQIPSPDPIIIMRGHAHRVQRLHPSIAPGTVADATQPQGRIPFLAQVLRADPQVFHCHGSLSETIWHSELGASAAVLAAGYNLDSLMLKYQGVDWRRGGDTWNCNRGYAQIPPAVP